MAGVAGLELANVSAFSSEKTHADQQESHFTCFGDEGRSTPTTDEADAEPQTANAPIRALTGSERGTDVFAPRN